MRYPPTPAEQAPTPRGDTPPRWIETHPTRALSKYGFHRLAKGQHLVFNPDDMRAGVDFGYPVLFGGTHLCMARLRKALTHFSAITGRKFWTSSHHLSGPKGYAGSGHVLTVTRSE